MTGKIINPSVFKFVQTVPATTWTVTHQLGSDGGQVPIVDVITADDTGALQKIIPMEVNIIDANTVQILFSSARSGTVIVLV